MPATSAARARLTTAAAALALAVALVLVIVSDRGLLRPVAILLGTLGVAATVGGLALARASSGPLAAALFGAAFLTTLYDRGPTLDTRTPLFAAALLLLAELVAWSAETTTGGIRIPDPGRRPPRLAVLAATTAAAWAATTALVAVVLLPIGRDLALTAAGATVVAALVALLLGVAERRSGDARGY